jgi:hypothetical protein
MEVSMFLKLLKHYCETATPFEVQQMWEEFFTVLIETKQFTLLNHISNAYTLAMNNSVKEVDNA